MYDALTGRFTFPCPARGEARVTLVVLSPARAPSGRRASRPSTTCSSPVAAATNTTASSATTTSTGRPLGLQGGVFYNLMTAQLDGVAAELSDAAARRIQAGEWPWSFFCYPEDRPRPVFPRRSSCWRRATARSRARRSLPDVPPDVGEPRLRTSTSTCPSTTTRRSGWSSTSSATTSPVRIEDFRAELYSASFDTRRLEPLSTRLLLAAAGTTQAPTSEVIECTDSRGRRRHWCSRPSPVC